MNRYLGLDVGTKRIGASISDALLYTAQPLELILRQPEEKAIETIINICKDKSVIGIVVGLPKNMDGTVGFQAEDVMNFAKKLEEISGIDIIYEDERLSSKQAERNLVEQNKKASRNKGLIDIASAAIILQQYLDRRSLSWQKEKIT